jgi:hypothetical protein
LRNLNADLRDTLVFEEEYLQRVAQHTGSHTHTGYSTACYDRQVLIAVLRKLRPLHIPNQVARLSAPERLKSERTRITRPTRRSLVTVTRPRHAVRHPELQPPLRDLRF